MPNVEPDNHSLSLLYVEDEKEAREMMSEIIRFRYSDVRFFVAENGTKGLSSFKRYRPDIVITDINMPVSSGIEMAAAIKSMDPAVEIIALTAYSDTLYLLQAIEIGISHYVLKPVDVDSFFKVVDKTVAQVRAAREAIRQNNLIRQLNVELADRSKELELANKELETYDYTVAHDLRSPMVIIRDVSRRVLDQHADKLDSIGTECLETIHREAVRVNNLADALLRLSVRTRKYPEKRKTDLSSMAHEISRNLAGQEPQRRVEFCIEEGVHGYCDPDLIRIVMDNLFGNAWKYSSAKDQVRIEFGTKSTQDDFVYFVRDNGSGFDEGEAEKLLAPFHRLLNDGAVEGFGIGLATAYRIIHRHGGRIWAEAEKGKGATFYFTL